MVRPEDRKLRQREIQQIDDNPSNLTSIAPPVMHAEKTRAAETSTRAVRVAVYHQGALGDFLLVLSVLEGLCRSRPGIRYDFWSKEAHFSLIAAREYAGAFHPADCPEAAALLHDRLWETAALPPAVAQAGAVFIFGQAGARILSERLRARLGRPVHWIRSFPGPADPAVHASEFVRRQLASLGWPAQPATPTLTAAPQDKEAARGWLLANGVRGKPAFIHPGSGGKRKVWPLAEWRRLIRWLAEDLRLPVILSLGPADGLLHPLAEAVRGPRVLELAGFPLARTAAVLSESLFYVGSDSGISHLAAACGIPAAAVFGPTDPAVWRPLGERTQVVQRSWREEEILALPPEFPSGPPDSGLAAIIESVLAVSGEP